VFSAFCPRASFHTAWVKSRRDLGWLAARLKNCDKSRACREAKPLPSARISPPFHKGQPNGCALTNTAHLDPNHGSALLRRPATATNSDGTELSGQPRGSARSPETIHPC
jgi:hypothetical protein